MFDERGANQAMDWLAENRPDLIETGIQVWAEQDPFSAGRFASRYDSFLQEEQAREAEAAQPAQPEPVNDPILAQMRAREQFTMLADGARQQLQIADEAWPTVRDNVVAVFNDDTTSPLIKNAIISPDPGTQFEGMKAIVSLAQQRALQAQSTAAEHQAQAPGRRRGRAAQARGHRDHRIPPPGAGGEVRRGDDERGADRALQAVTARAAIYLRPPGPHRPHVATGRLLRGPARPGSPKAGRGAYSGLTEHPLSNQPRKEWSNGSHVISGQTVDDNTILSNERVIDMWTSSPCSIPTSRSSRPC